MQYDRSNRKTVRISTRYSSFGWSAKISESDASIQDKKRKLLRPKKSLSSGNEREFAGTTDAQSEQNLRQLRVEQENKETEEDRF